MNDIFKYKDKAVVLYKKYEPIVNGVLKFLLAILILSYINSSMGYAQPLTKLPIVLGISLICGFVPISIMVLLMALVVIVHLIKLNIILAAFAAIVFILFYLFYLKFAPDQGVLILIYPVLARWNLQYMLPMIAAMVFNPFAAIPLGFAVITMKLLIYIQEASAGTTTKLTTEGLISSYQYVVDHLLGDKEMMTYIVVFALVVIATYAIARLSFDYAWYVGIGVGVGIMIVGLIFQSAAYGVHVNIVMVIIGSLLGGIIAAGIQYLGHAVDYGSKEMLQFEDDDYYYKMMIITTMLKLSLRLVSVGMPVMQQQLFIHGAKRIKKNR